MGGTERQPFQVNEKEATLLDHSSDGRRIQWMIHMGVHGGVEQKRKTVWTLDDAAIRVKAAECRVPKAGMPIRHPLVNTAIQQHLERLTVARQSLRAIGRRTVSP